MNSPGYRGVSLLLQNYVLTGTVDAVIIGRARQLESLCGIANHYANY